MQIIVHASQALWEELTGKNKNIDWVRVDNVNSFSIYKDAAAFFNLNNDAAQEHYPPGLPVIFINSIVTTLKEIEQNSNKVRINGWNGFLKSGTWEITGKITDDVTHILEAIGVKATVVKDEPGFVSARILAMIINEAYFAKEENVSSEKDIDIAMRLGTNYPMGPFEWANVIGVKYVVSLLNKLHETDEMYAPAPLLLKEARLL